VRRKSETAVAETAFAPFTGAASVGEEAIAKKAVHETFVVKFHRFPKEGFVPDGFHWYFFF
jgi:hypothetical protein